jgi:bidirectional [NiFe] hydrogenase diaphorase subunit
MIVMDEDTCMVDVARYFIAFSDRRILRQMRALPRRDCGRCTASSPTSPKAGEKGDIETLEELSETAMEASLCALGKSAPNPFLSTLRYFRDEYEAHIKEKSVPGPVLQGTDRLPYIDPEKCKACMICLRKCPADAIDGGKNKIHVVDQEKCTKCGTCFEVCPPRFGAVQKGFPASRFPPILKKKNHQKEQEKMSDILLQIDGKEVKAAGRDDVLEAAQGAGIHPHALPSRKAGALRGMPALHRGSGKARWTKLVVSCVYPVEKGSGGHNPVRKVDRIRKTILELLLAHAPDAFELQDLAKEYGADKNRFEKEASFCIHCGLCPVLRRGQKKHAVGFVDRGTRKEISFIPEIAAKECWDCKECFPLCPTSYLTQAVMRISYHRQALQCGGGLPDGFGRRISGGRGI